MSRRWLRMPTEIHKFANGIWNAITELAYQDGATLRNITEVHYNDNGTFRQVFGSSISAQTLAWSASAPTGTYFADSNTGTAQMQFTCDASGNFNFTFITGVDGTSTGTPTSGQYKPVIEVDASNYEFSLLVGGVSGTGVSNALGSGTLINGTFQPLNILRGVEMINSTISTTGEISVTAEIRQISTPANTTGPTTFILKSDGRTI